MQYKKWMPPMLHERVVRARYDRTMARFGEGRYAGAFKSAVSRKQVSEDL